MTRSRWKKLQVTKTEHKVFIHLPDGGRIVWDPRADLAQIEIKSDDPSDAADDENLEP